VKKGKNKGTQSEERNDELIASQANKYIKDKQIDVNLTFLISKLMHKILVYLHIIYLLKSSTCFEHYPAHLQEVYVVIVYMQSLVSSLGKSESSKITVL
jgi:glutaminase